MRETMKLYGQDIASRLLIGTALYPSPAVMEEAIRASGAEIVTVSLRREAGGGKAGDAFWKIISSLGLKVLPNTAGCRTVRDAVTTAAMARELFGTPWVKLEVIGDDETLQPDVVGLVEAAEILIRDGFEVFPYCTEDLTVIGRLIDVGCQVVMPWASPIGSAKGLLNPYLLQDAARAFSRRADDHRRRPRRALARGRGAGDGVRRRAAQHGRSPRRPTRSPWRAASGSRSRPAASASRPG